MISFPINRFSIQLTLTFVVFFDNTLAAPDNKTVYQKNKSPCDWCKSQFNQIQSESIKEELINECIRGIESTDEEIQSLTAELVATEAEKQFLKAELPGQETFTQDLIASSGATDEEIQSLRAELVATKTFSQATESFTQAIIALSNAKNIFHGASDSDIAAKIIFHGVLNAELVARAVYHKVTFSYK